jgi:quercetin dioxygenase-like cupin family protein
MEKNGMRRLQFKTVVLFIFLSVAFNLPCASGADYDGGVKVTLIKKATTASNGQKLSYPGAGNPEVTALIVEIPPGGNTGWHSHPIPVYAYVLSGSLTVEMDHSGPYRFKEGDALFEVIDTPHIGRNPGKEPVKLMVFYTGVEGTPSTEKISR